VSQSSTDIRLGIAGSGAIACGLARLASVHIDTVLWARSSESADRAREEVGQAVTVITDLDALSDRTLVIEAVTEDFRAKSDLLGGLGVLLPSDSLVATTTSSLSVKDLAVASGRPDRFGAMHVFNPVEKMALVEVVFPEAATEATRSGLEGSAWPSARRRSRCPTPPASWSTASCFPLPSRPFASWSPRA